MYICHSCKNSINPYKKKCAICNEPNINFNESVVIGPVLFFVAVIVGILLFYIFPEFGMLQFVAFLILIGLIIVVYFRYICRDEFEERIKLIIEEKGDSLFSDNDVIPLDDFLLECGWKTDDSKLTESFNKYVFEIASQKKWKIKDNSIHKN